MIYNNKKNGEISHKKSWLDSKVIEKEKEIEEIKRELGRREFY